MKFSIFYSALSVILSAVVGYFVYDNVEADSNKLLYALGFAITLLLVLMTSFAGKVKDSKVNVNLKTWGGVAFILMVILNILLICLSVSTSVYILVMAIGVIIHLVVLRSLLKADVA